MSNQLERSITQFTAWRTELVAAIDEFRSWFETCGQADMEEMLRIYDLVEDLQNDRILLALLGDSAESKIGLINALLFSDRPGGLLPSGPGCGNLCVTEIYHDPSESPYVRVLPMDTRKKQQSIAALRRNPIEWVTMRLNPDSPESVSEAMHSLIESRTVSVEEAKSLNLTHVEHTGDEVSIPAWRYALINIPHPMLKSGLTALYSPSLHMLSAEPEVALRIASNAQSLLMVLDQELTPTARDFWKQYMQSSEAHKFVVLDSDAGAERGAAARVAQTLEIPSTRIFLMPVERAVGARLAQQVAEAETAGAIEQIEQLHADEVVPDRKAHLLVSVAKEIGPQVQSGRQTVAARFIATVREMLDLTSSSMKNRSMAEETLSQLETERKTYAKAVSTFDVIYDNLMSKGEELVATLNDDRIEEILSHDRAFIQGAWTTTGMWNSMRKLFGYFTLQVEKIFNYSFKLRETVEGIYQNFHENFGLVKVSPPPLTLQKYVAAMKALEVNARSFCHDPVNIAKYKDYMLKSFYDGLVTEARRLFELTRHNTGHWVRGALGPLKDQIMERQTLMLKRVENLRSLKDDHTSMQERLKQLNEERLSLKKQGDQLDHLRFDLDLPVPWAPVKPPLPNRTAASDVTATRV